MAGTRHGPRWCERMTRQAAFGAAGHYVACAFARNLLRKAISPSCRTCRARSKNNAPQSLPPSLSGSVAMSLPHGRSRVFAKAAFHSSNSSA